MNELALQLADIRGILKKLDDFGIHAGETHPFRLKHKALAEGNRRLFLQTAEELRHGFDDIHSLLTDAQGHAHRFALTQQAQRDLHFKRRFHRQGALQRAHQRPGVLPCAAAAHFFNRAGRNRLHHRGGEVTARFMHVSKKVA